MAASQALTSHASQNEILVVSPQVEQREYQRAIFPREAIAGGRFPPRA
ncbi:MAG: hypothetical protein NVS4B7_17940 [Ktedonobacteraceae bacterium]